MKNCLLFTLLVMTTMPFDTITAEYQQLSDDQLNINSSEYDFESFSKELDIRRSADDHQTVQTPNVLLIPPVTQSSVKFDEVAHSLIKSAASEVSPAYKDAVALLSITRLDNAPNESTQQLEKLLVLSVLPEVHKDLVIDTLCDALQNQKPLDFIKPILEYIKTKKININQQDANKKYDLPLAIAVKKHHLAIDPLLEVGADSLVKNNAGVNSFHCAVALSTDTISSRLFECAENKNQLLSDKGGKEEQTPLMVAITNKSLNNVKWLVEKKIFLTLTPKIKMAILHCITL